MEGLLREEPYAPVWAHEFAGLELRLERAVEFWPLLGDVASQESGGSRTVDSSTARLQLTLRRLDPTGPALDDWSVRVARFAVPLQSVEDDGQTVRLIGIRYRDFAPWRGLHPAIGPLGPVVIELSRPEFSQVLRVTLHHWHPHGMAYDGLPGSLEVADARRRERLVAEVLDAAEPTAVLQPPADAMNGYTLDLRLCQIGAL